MTANPVNEQAADPLVIADRRFQSRLLMGSGGYPNQQVMLDALAAAAPARRRW
jgi:thiazole synthase